MPVGFKWFVPGLLDGSLGFGGEESAGASFLRRDGTVWTTDKDGIVMDLLAVEIMARTGRDPSEVYLDLTRELGAPVYQRIDAPATAEQKAVLLKLSPGDVHASELAGDPIQAMLTTAPGNGASIGGLESRHRAGVVRGTSFRYGRSLQAVRRKLSWEGSPAAHSGRSAGSSRLGALRSHQVTAGIFNRPAQQVYLVRHGETESRYVEALPGTSNSGPVPVSPGSFTSAMRYR